MPIQFRYRSPGAPVQYQQPPAKSPAKSPIKYNPAAGYDRYRPATATTFAPFRQPAESLTPGAPGPTPYDLPAYVPGGGSAPPNFRYAGYVPATASTMEPAKAQMAAARAAGVSPPIFGGQFGKPVAHMTRQDWIAYALSHPPNPRIGLATWATGWQKGGPSDWAAMQREGVKPAVGGNVSGQMADFWLGLLGEYAFGVNPYSPPLRPPSVPAAPAPAGGGGGGGSAPYPAYPKGGGGSGGTSYPAYPKGGGGGGGSAYPVQRQGGRYTQPPNLPRWFDELTNWTIRG